MADNTPDDAGAAPAAATQEASHASAG